MKMIRSLCSLKKTMMVLSSLLGCGMAHATVVANLNADLYAGWSDTGQGGAIGITDNNGGSYMVGWIQGGPATADPKTMMLPTVGNNDIMGGWGWPDNSGSRGPGFPRGYSWDGTHDTGWAAYVGFEVTTGTTMNMRGNDNWNGSGTAPVVQWTSGVTGLATFTFSIGSSFGAGALFGIYDYQTGLWASAGGGDNLFTGTPNATARPDLSGYSNVEEAGSMTYTTTVNIGDQFLFAARSATPAINVLSWNTANVDVTPVPEPSSAAMLLGGFALLGLYFRKKSI